MSLKSFHRAMEPFTMEENAEYPHNQALLAGFEPFKGESARGHIWKRTLYKSLSIGHLWV